MLYIKLRSCSLLWFSLIHSLLHKIQSFHTVIGQTHTSMYLCQASEQTYFTVHLCALCELICGFILRVCEYLHVCVSVRLNRGQSHTNWKKNVSAATSSVYIQDSKIQYDVFNVLIAAVLLENKTNAADEHAS